MQNNHYNFFKNYKTFAILTYYEFLSRNLTIMTPSYDKLLVKFYMLVYGTTEIVSVYK
jgi:hypothetical protein